MHFAKLSTEGLALLEYEVELPLHPEEADFEDVHARLKGVHPTHHRGQRLGEGFG